MMRKIFILVLFLSGVVLLFYPMVSDFIYSQRHFEVISKYDEEAREKTQEEKGILLAEARKRNEELSRIQQPLHDPYSEEKGTSEVNLLDIGELMGHVEIPKINIDLPIYSGTSEDALRQGTGYLEHSSLPVGGISTHTVLTAHRGLPSTKLFRHLDKMEIGDVFFIHTLGETLAYEVDQLKVVLPHEFEYTMIIEGKDYATLLTCEPYMINTHRLLVRGERIPYSPEEASRQKEKQMETIQSNFVYLLMAVVGVSLLFGIVLLRKKSKKQPNRN